MEKLTINIPSFVPGLSISAPAATTHYKFVSAGTELDFVQKTFKRDVKESAALPWDKTATAAMSIVHTLTPNSTLPLFLVFGVQFFQQVGGSMSPMLKGSANVLTVIDVSKP